MPSYPDGSHTPCVEAGHDAVHTYDLAAGNRTSDSDVSTTADQEHRVVVTKDSDFVSSFWLHSRPNKLLLVSTGNISNDELLTLARANLAAIISALSQNRFVELTRTSLAIHA
jgi:predicted nuclease of predicted toxin-antitoxin system